MNDTAAAPSHQQDDLPSGAARRVQLLDRTGAELLELRIPNFVKPPGLIVAHRRTFQLSAYGITEDAERAAPHDTPAEQLANVLMYAETFSYVVPEEGHPPTSLAAELEELEKLRAFRKRVLDPLMQPTSDGTILTHIVDKLFGANASATAGQVHRQQARGG